MKNKYPSVAPRPSSEQKDDDDILVNFKPNGDDIHYYNLGQGNRRRIPFLLHNHMEWNHPNEG